MNNIPSTLGGSPRCQKCQLLLHPGDRSSSTSIRTVKDAKTSGSRENSDNGGQNCQYLISLRCFRGGRIIAALAVHCATLVCSPRNVNLKRLFNIYDFVLFLVQFNLAVGSSPKRRLCESKVDQSIATAKMLHAIAATLTNVAPLLGRDDGKMRLASAASPRLQT